MSTVLVIDDSVTDMSVVTGCLSQAGISVLKASSSEEALEILDTNNPDVIILDVVLPGISGFELCRDLKESDKTSNIPIILSSTKESEMDKFWGLKQGADAYLPKPVDQEELLKTVQKLI